ncbi:hypothetical protein [Nannocystis pusilla]|uniref:Secreted protein n=1 Tax=Nannocystis pusilla TaxID=889268 RepID=A0ABS7U026_9BACT|nr:hypothetical protein [Nannocystis pusilla]MBZ5713879.1 hypothetical protein [Nannocystis pusilla]
MRDLCRCLVLALACACNPTDDTKTGSGSSTSGGTSTTDGTGSGSGSESTGTTAPTSGDDPACAGDYLCFGADAADCEDDRCCVAAFGRRYEQDGDAWCLHAEQEYVGCAHKYNSAPCDHTGTIQCVDMDDHEYFAELESECFPHSCLVGVPPAADAAVCGG